MIYHTWSLTGLMLWSRYSLAQRKFLSMADVYSAYLESPGTKAYTVKEAQDLIAKAGFSRGDIHIQLAHGDLLEGGVGQRHQGLVLRVAKDVWRSAEHTSELQSLMRSSYAVFCLKKKSTNLKSSSELY